MKHPLFVVLALVLAAVWSAGFIAMKCYSGSPSQAAARTTSE